MISQLIATLAGFVIHLINTFGYLGIALCMAIESANIPLPSEIIMPFAGFLVSTGHFAFWVTVLAGALGGTLGSLLSFCLGYYGGETLIRRLIRRFGKYVLVFEYELDEAEHWFNRFGQWITFATRMLPIVRTFISLPAGMSKMDIKKFTLFAFLGTFLWCIPLTFIGMKLGENWDTLGGVFHKFDAIIGLCLMGLVVFYIYHKLKKHHTWQATHAKP